MSKEYKKLLGLCCEAKILSSMAQLLEWDKQVQMPPEAVGARDQQAGFMVNCYWDRITGRATKETLNKLLDLKTGKLKVKGLNEIQAAIVQKTGLQYLYATKLTKQFRDKYTEKARECSQAFQQARQFSELAPLLKEMVDLAKERADRLGYSKHPYDALLDEHEPGLDTKTFDKLVEPLSDLPAYYKHLLTQPQPARSCLDQPLPPPLIMEIIHQLIGPLSGKERFDLGNSAFFVAIHPNDVRFTIAGPTLKGAIRSLHEWGHAFYHTHLPEGLYGTPLCEPASTTMAEAIARFWEIHVGRDKAIVDQLESHLTKHMGDLSLYEALHAVYPSPNRKDADEIARTLHILMRYELEKALIGGDLSVDDLPDAWNQKSYELLDVFPENDREGCMQDIHWSLGLFGMVPTYLLADCYAAQLYEAFEETHPNWEMSNVREWLHQNICRWGKVYNPSQLLQLTTEKPLSAEPYLNYIHKTYNVLQEA